MGVSSPQLVDIQRTTIRTTEQRRELFWSHPTGKHSVFLLRTQLVLKSYWRVGDAAEMSLCLGLQYRMYGYQKYVFYHQKHSQYRRSEEKVCTCSFKEEGSFEDVEPAIS